MEINMSIDYHGPGDFLNITSNWLDISRWQLMLAGLAWKSFRRRTLALSLEIGGLGILHDLNASGQHRLPTWKVEKSSVARGNIAKFDSQLIFLFLSSLFLLLPPHPLPCAELILDPESLSLGLRYLVTLYQLLCALDLIIRVLGTHVLSELRPIV